MSDRPADRQEGFLEHVVDHDMIVEVPLLDLLPGVLEPLLERFLNRVTCRILWLIPCPSRTTSFVVGVIAGGAVAVALTRE